MGRVSGALSLRCPADPAHTAFKGSQRACFDSSVDLDRSAVVLRRVVGRMLYDVSDPRDDEIRCAVCGAHVWQPWNSICFIPSGGEMLLCSFATGFQPPEMVKVRPVVILSGRRQNRQTCIVVPASTVPPKGRKGFAVELAGAKYSFLNRTTWAKCGMVTTVSLRRLFFFRDLSTGRNLDSRSTTIDASDLMAIRRSAALALGVALT